MASNRGRQILESFRELFQSGETWAEANIVLIMQRYHEYQKDRLSVPPEWRKPLDDFHNFIEECRDAQSGNTSKRKDDEAFRLFPDEDGFYL